MPRPRPEPVGRDLLTKEEVAQFVRLSPRTIARYVARGRFPPPIRFSQSCVRWRRKDIEEYLRGLADRGRAVLDSS
jgi:prophage regulatory protein